MASHPTPLPGMSATGAATVTVENGIATLSFYHPKSNSLPGPLLQHLALKFDELARHGGVRVIVLRSEGNGPFCAGASFDELKAIETEEQGKEFFSGFARLILAMRRCPKFIVTRVHGKAVGGGIGIVSASDFAFAVEAASVRLSELAVGIGPFVVGPVIQHRIGRGPFSAMAVDADWRDAAWCERHGLYSRVADSIPALDATLRTLVTRLAASNPEAMEQMKRVFWEGTNHWDTLLFERAAMSGRLVLSDFTRNALAAFDAR